MQFSNANSRWLIAAFEMFQFFVRNILEDGVQKS